MPTLEDGFRTYNPVIGCPIGCRYCYARALNRRFKFVEDFDQLHWRGPYGLHANGSPELFTTRDLQSVNWFLTSMSDFGLWEKEWVDDILNQCDLGNQWKHKNGKPLDTFTFLTKRPERLDLSGLGDRWLRNAFVGVTVTRTDEVGRIQSLVERTMRYKVSKLVTFEPLLEDMVLQEGDLKGIDWVIVGPETGNAKGKVPFQKEWMDGIIHACHSAGVPLKMKSVLKDVMSEQWCNQMPPVQQ